MKPDCAHAAELLSPYIDGMLDETQARALRLHLDACAACGTEYAQLARMREALLGLPEVPLPAEFDARLRRALATRIESAPAEPDPPARGFSRRRLRLWSSAAAVFAIGLLSLFAYNNLSGTPFEFGSASNDAAEDALVAEATDDGSAGRASADDAEAAAAPKTGAEEAAAAEGERADPVADAEAEFVAPVRIYANGAGEPIAYERYERPGGPARGTTPGAQRLNEKALYDEMLKERLAGWTYEISEEEKRDGAYVYRVNMISNEAGMTFNQEIEIVAFGNALHIYYASEFMGF
jgi:hypothetical protein